MAVRKIVQDSDNEDDSDHGPPSASKVPPQLSGSTVVDLECSSAASTSAQIAQPSTGSTEALTREILIAQNSLLDPTPSSKTSDAIVTQPITTTQSPTMSKLKRRQTTGGTPDYNKKRVLKTYRAKASKDDFDFHGSNDEGGDIVLRKRQKREDMSIDQVSRKGKQKRESQFSGSSASNDPLQERQDAGQTNFTTADADSDIIITAASRALKKRAMSLSVFRDAHEVTLTTHRIDHGSRATGAEYSVGSNETPSGDSATKKKRSRRRLTTHSSSSAAQQESSVLHSEVVSGGAPVNVLETASSEMGGLSRASPDVLSLAQHEPQIQSNSTSRSTEMLPPLVKHALALQPNSDYSCPSTVPNTTPTQTSEAQAADADELSYLKPLSWTSSARMTSPTIAGNSTQEIEHASEHSASANKEGKPKPPRGSLNIQLAEKDTTTNSTSRASPPAKGRSQPSVLLATDPQAAQGLDHETEGELLNLSATLEDSGTNPQPPKGKLKRKAQDDNHTDDLGSDDIAVGLPKEQYQPRPSRSRANRADDQFLLAVDFSKRPEAVVKAKIKRRRTTGGHIPTHEDVTVENISELGDDEPKALRETKNKRMKATGDQGAPHEDANVVELLQHDTDRREKHEEAKDTAGKPEQEAILHTIDGNKGHNMDEDDIPVAKAEEPKKKRGRPRKKTTEEPPSHPKPFNDKPPAASAATAKEPTNPAPATKKTAKRRNTNDTTTQISEERIVSDNEEHHPGADDTTHDDTDKSNPAPPASPPRQSNPAPPVQTPQKPAPKGPDKHSPLNSGKVPYRVGLSKKARIEPLLRVVRK